MDTSTHRVLQFLDIYLGFGLAIIPLVPKSKMPLVEWKRFQSLPPTREQIFRWFSEYPNANVGGLMGVVSGNVIAIDIDKRSGGVETMKNLLLPETFTTVTGGGGFHYFYRASKPIRKHTGILQGIDLIANGGYCVLPPSIHESGKAYEICRKLPIVPAPAWVYGNQENLSSSTGASLSNQPKGQIQRGCRHDSILKSVRGYAADSRYFIHLWKRSYSMVMKCTIPSQEDPITFSELFEICFWAWNETHAQAPLAHGAGVKMLQGRARTTGDITFGTLSAPLHSFHPKDMNKNFSASQLLNTTTSQLPNIPRPKDLYANTDTEE